MSAHHNDRYNFNTRQQVILDENDYAGTTRNQVRLDCESVAGLTRGIVRMDRPWLHGRQDEA